MSRLTVLLNDHCLRRLCFFVAEKATASLLNLVIVILQEESEFLEWLDVVNIYYVYPLQLFFSGLLFYLQEVVVVL